LSLYSLTKFLLLQLFPESIHWLFLLSVRLVVYVLIPGLVTPKQRTLLNVMVT